MSSNESFVNDILVTFKLFSLVLLAFEKTKWIDIKEKQKKNRKALE